MQQTRRDAWGGCHVRMGAWCATNCALRRPGEDRYYWLTAEFVVELVAPASDPAITLYHARRSRQPRRAAVSRQSDWQGIEFFTVEETKP